MLEVLTALVMVLSFSAVTSAQRGPEVLASQKFVFQNKNCEANATCDLKETEFILEDYRILVGGADSYNHGTRLFAKYRTDSLSGLNKYIFVSFKRGCMYSSTKARNGLVIEELNLSRLQNSEFVEWRFPRWTIDSVDSDPAYNSRPDKSRHYDYRWNTVSGSVSLKTEKFFGDEIPDYPELYVTDHPGTAYFMNGVAKNISLEFRTCLYKTADVPAKIKLDDIFSLGAPVACFVWNSSWIYDHETSAYESKEEIAPICR